MNSWSVTVNQRFVILILDGTEVVFVIMTHVGRSKGTRVINAIYNQTLEIGIVISQ